MTRCHDGLTYLVPTTERDGTDAVAVMCSTCHAVLAVGPRHEVSADL